jgi:transketolase
MIPFVSAAAPFLTGRALEQIKADVAYSRARVILCGQSPGMAYGELGPTHHSIEDLSWLRAVADLPIVVPVDPNETRAAVRWAAAHDGPSYLRIGRHPVPAIDDEPREFVLGRSVEVRAGTSGTVIAAGTMVSRALDAADLLSGEGIELRVINMSSIEPLDTAAVLRAADETGAVVTVEEATTTGGLGAAVAAVLAQARPVPMRILGVPRQFAPTGSTDFLLEYFELTAQGVADAARAVIGHARG